MRHHQNILDLISLKPDYIGFIFYPKSPRYAGNILKPETTALIPEHIRKTGVFVNAKSETIKETCRIFNLNTVQLHGEESTDQCLELKEEGYEIIKAFSLKDEKDKEKTNDYKEVCDFFLFDTPTHQYGGSGQKFDWSILAGFEPARPFFLSGGIESQDAPGILKGCPAMPYALDINSRFESEPGLKNIAAIEQFIKTIRKQ
ncbi:phosphoribosylanthranilate isomerase [Marinilabilia sp.]|uniref:phosphoribosylanthranilate isomerase n=1 Tax=Marinilabilia sp. TaxID=2021252 RepID=UPI0025BBD730|nr:phosphoribosylanthranilate isomerase [Marinilabilia sp.]